jgi:hypothetical protein
MGAIYTARVTYGGKDRVDITAKGGSFFAPSWPLLNRFLAVRKSGRETEETWTEYTEAYMAEMRNAYRRDKSAFHTLASSNATLVCYCTGTHCHRFLLAGILVKLGATYRGERT